MLSNISVTIEQCSASGCTPVIDNVLLTDLGPSSDVIYSGKQMPGQSVSYVIRMSMSSNTPNKAEGQLAQVGYSLVAVGN
jgi:hypothetical protein